jgi:hypothetical protein
MTHVELMVALGTRLSYASLAEPEILSVMHGFARCFFARITYLSIFLSFWLPPSSGLPVLTSRSLGPTRPSLPSGQGNLSS